MPYRIEIVDPPADAVDLLVRWEALDIEQTGEGVAAILPDHVTEATVVSAVGQERLRTSRAVARDSGSVWLLSPRAVQIGGLRIAPADVSAEQDALRLIDADAFGTGHHPTTVLCIEALQEIVASEPVNSVLDVGTGSGILALAALRLGVRHAVGIDIDAGALEAAAENARLNRLSERLELRRGGPEIVGGQWPLVMANVLAAPLMDMAPVLVQRVARGGRLVLSGIPSGLEADIRRAYQRYGMQQMTASSRAGWVALVAQAGW